MIGAVLATLLFAFSSLCGLRAARLVGGTEANFWRLAIATFLLGCWSYTFGLGLGGEAMVLFFVSGLIGFGIGDVALYQALPRLGARLTMVFTQCLAAPFGALIEWGWLGTRLSLTQTAAMLVIVAGVGVAIAPGKGDAPERLRIRHGTVFGVLAALGGAVGAVLSRKAFAVAEAAGESVDGGTAAFQRIVGGLLIGGLVLLFVRWKQHDYSTRPHADLPPARDAIPKWRRLGGWVVANALAGSVLGVSCMQWALRTTPTGIVLAIIAMTPLVLIPLARLFEGERITPRSVIGSVMAVAGVVGLTLSR